MARSGRVCDFGLPRRLLRFEPVEADCVVRGVGVDETDLPQLIGLSHTDVDPVRSREIRIGFDAIDHAWIAESKRR